MKNIAIIFAGGSGVRMGSGIPKQFIEVNCKPIIIHTLDIFEDAEEIDEIYISCKPEYIEKLKKMVKKFQIDKVVDIVAGGSSAQESVYNAISHVAQKSDGDSIILIHDGVRPCINQKTIRANIESVKNNGSAITSTPFYETPLLTDDAITVSSLPNRECCYRAQAPQSFYLKDVVAAHEKIREDNPNYDGIIDTCTLMKAVGHEVFLVDGPRGNIKVTTPEDLFVFRALIQYQETESAFGLSENDIDINKKR